MDILQLSYGLFILVLIVSLVIDLGVLGRKKKDTDGMSTRSAMIQYSIWIIIALGYFVFLYFNYEQEASLNYLISYFTEMSLSVDNLFVFILVFTTLKVKEENIGKALTMGILLAILFRIIFIFIGIGIVERFEWVLAIFGIFLLYTGVKIFFAKAEDNDEEQLGKIERFFEKRMRFTNIDSEGHYTVRLNNKRYFTKLSLAVLLIGVSDIMFAVDSIPAVLAITTDKLIVYSSNIFAILGLRPLYFILQRAKDKFDYVQEGVSLVLIFIGIKILLHFIWHIDIPVIISFATVIGLLGGSILFSFYFDKEPRTKKDEI